MTKIEPVTPEPAPEADGFLTGEEMRVIDLAAQLWNTMCRDVVGDGPSRAGDLRELAAHVHGIQQMVMSQAAARAYPSKLRPLGGAHKVERSMDA